MKTNTNRDAKIAEAVGWEAWESLIDLDGNKVDVPFLVLHKPNGKGMWAEGATNVREFKKVPYESWMDIPNLPHYLKPPPFITAPTYETDGVVLEWVQGQDAYFIEKIANAVMDIIIKREGYVAARQDQYLRGYLTSKKPGDIALALEAVMEERDG